MPTYEYRCQSCGTRFEVWQKMSDDPLTTCQTCGGPVHRVLYPAGIVFKGSGFYSTDNRSSGSSASSSQSSSASGDSAGSGSASGGNAPAAASESKTSTTPKS
jgi:putative FmdB family regulatory protein